MSFGLCSKNLAENRLNSTEKRRFNPAPVSPSASRVASTGGNAESRQPQYHNRAGDEAPTTGDGKANGERESALDLFC